MMDIQQTFISIVKRYNTAAKREHASYMCRGNGHWYKDRDKYDARMAEIDLEFKCVFRDMFEDDYDDFSLSHYETDDPELMCKYWFGEIDEDEYSGVYEQ
jgi:hypothetical protein